MSKSWKIRALAQKTLWAIPGGMHINSALSKLTSGHDPIREIRGKQGPNLIRHLKTLSSLGTQNFSTSAILELGTGWDLNVALLLSLCGFGQVTTADAYRHVRLEQVRRCLPALMDYLPELSAFITKNQDELNRLFTKLGGLKTIEELCQAAGVKYIAPVSSQYSEIANGSVDYWYSTAVFEHIRPEDLRNILRTFRSKLKPNGLASHVIDLKDHFAYFQHGLPYNHFLRFPGNTSQREKSFPLLEKIFEWAKEADPRSR